VTRRLFRRAARLAAALTMLGVGGCAPPSDPRPAADSLPATSPLDVGPRAAEAPVAPALAERGERLYKGKGCLACHAYGKRQTGPDLKGVTRRRTAAWMEAQILHPERMIRQDPIARALFREYNLQMSNQGLTPEEARAIIEYFKKLDRDTP
jgi:cytochrome c551/c552